MVSCETMRFDVLTIFPKMFSGYFSESIIKRAQKKKLLDIRVHDLRQWATDKHHKVDDKPYGGGPGMVFKVAPIARALRALKYRMKNAECRIVLTSARGKQFTAADARRLAKYKRLVIICGRYEGVDERVAKHLVDEEISIGPYVLTGGELPAMVMIDSIARQIPGVLGKSESLEEARGGGFPTYTRPGVFEMQNAECRMQKWKARPPKFRKAKIWRVPKVLLSGDHKKIVEWRRKYSILGW